MPNQEPELRHVSNNFWRNAASGNVPSLKAKRKRCQTLSRKRTSLRKLPKHVAKKPMKKKKKRRRGSEEEWEDEEDEEWGSGDDQGGESDYLPSEEDSDDYEVGSGEGDSDEDLDVEAEFDDVDEDLYLQRCRRYKKLRVQQTAAAPNPEGGTSTSGSSSNDDIVFDGGMRVPAFLYEKLFDYQRTGLKWLWELYAQRAGGIIGDEMGLGKTIQIIVFLAGLHYSGLYRPSLVVCPATVLRQWMRELRSWYPPFRVVMFHESAKTLVGLRPSRQALVDLVCDSRAGLLLTTYDQMRIHRDLLLPVHWGCVVLDEGHKIRNPDSEITLVCKQVQTVHRLIMTGSPIQNRLSELWSLFDFVFPGKLGTLPVFQAQFAVPIQVGGYVNATRLQVSMAYKCALILRDLISPYLLRRRKVDVNAQLTKKTEQVLFCGLTTDQRHLYRAYLASADVQQILEGRRQALQGIDILRKICNHPDLLERAEAAGTEDYGNPIRSGKLTVTDKVLTHWKVNGHKVLVFAQTQQMLDILEKLVVSRGYKYHRMDGSTTVATRTRLMDDFNNNPSVFVFLLTTKVGGLGVNLIGADRVLLYDPDWNPSTDMQARERAWRIGQKRDVTIYRLITGGTIEEKVYHRQIYKNFLTNKVLKDPRQKRFFTARDMADLFTLADEHQPGTETGQIFREVGEHILIDDGATPVTQGEGSEGTGGGPPGSLRLEGTSANDSGNGQSSRQMRLCGAVESRGEGRGGSKCNDRDQESAALCASEDSAGRRTPESGEGDETRVLRDLFEGTGIVSLMDHSRIETSNDPETLAVDQQAARMAAKAAEALKRSRAACRTAAVNQPTWTGRHGTAGVTPPRNKFGRPTTSSKECLTPPKNTTQSGSGGPKGRVFGTRGTPPIPTNGAPIAGVSGCAAPSSSSLLAQIRARQQAPGMGPHLSAAAPSTSSATPPATPGSEGEGGPGTEAGDGTADILLCQIVSFLEAKGGAAPSKELVDHFNQVVRPQQMMLFRQLLKQVATLTKTSASGSSQWTLKDEFRT